MPDLTAVIGETGFNVDFTIIDKETDAPLDLGDFGTSIVLNIMLSDFTSGETPISLTRQTPFIDGIARWAVSTDIPATAAAYFMQITLIGTGGTRTTKRMDLLVQRKLT